MEDRINVLLIEDDPDDALLIQEMLCFDKESPFALTQVSTLQEGIGCLTGRPNQVVLLDLGLPDGTGLQTLQRIMSRAKDTSVVVYTGDPDEGLGIAALREGAQDYLIKGQMDGRRLQRILRYAVERKKMQNDLERAIVAKDELLAEKERIEQALVSSELTIQCLADSNIIGIVTGDLSGRIIEANAAFLKMLGYSRTELVGGKIRWDTLTPPEYRDQDRTRLGELASSGVAVPWEKEFFRKDGSRLPVLIGVVTAPRDQGGADSIAFVVDLSKRKSLERQLRQSQKMEAVGCLAGGIAHDFNNLLGVIIGYSEILEERLGQDDPLRSKAGQIKKAGKHAASLTRQLLAFSRQQVLEPVILDLNATVTDIVKILQRVLGEDVELITAFDPELGRVKADPGQIEQVILNLASNARDAMPHGGKLTITTANADLDESFARQHSSVVPGPHVVLTVSDMGCGMDAETQLHIFEPFFTTKGKEKGTGLGLATVYGVVVQSHGSIWVYSEPGQGSTFKIYLPQVGEAKTAAVSDQGELWVGRGSATVLLVEDEESLRKLTKELLEDVGYTVLEAADGAGAIHVAEEHDGPIDLLLTDVVLPGMDGPKVADSIRLIYPAIKVLYASGHTGDSIAHHGVLDSGVTLLQKPFTRAMLNKKVREVLGVAEESKHTRKARKKRENRKMAWLES